MSGKIANVFLKFISYKIHILCGNPIDKNIDFKMFY